MTESDDMNPAGVEASSEDRPHLTLLIPAYNEALRITASLREMDAYLEARPYTSSPPRPGPLPPCCAEHTGGALLYNSPHTVTAQPTFGTCPKIRMDALIETQLSDAHCPTPPPIQPCGTPSTLVSFCHHHVRNSSR